MGVSNILTEVGVKMARPWGRIKGEIPRREWDKSESGKKYAATGRLCVGR